MIFLPCWTNFDVIAKVEIGRLNFHPSIKYKDRANNPLYNPATPNCVVYTPRSVVANVVFAEGRFTKAPKVTVSILKLDIPVGMNYEIVVSNVSAKGFTANFIVWCDTVLSTAEVDYIAVGV